MIQVNRIYLIFNSVHFLVDSSDFPILMLCAFAKPAFVNRSFFIYLLAFYFVLLLVWWIWNKQIYRASRRKAVMKHYADVNFNPGKGFLLFFMPLIFFIGVVITICSLME